MKKAILVICITISAMLSNAQTIANFNITVPGQTAKGAIPVTIDVSGLPRFTAEKAVLTQTEVGKKPITIPFQLDPEKNTLTFMATKAGKQTFYLAFSSPSSPKSIETIDKDGAITIRDGDKDLLRYVHKTVFPPAGIDTNYKRSGFIHPLWTPHGQALTRIQPPDHYHHYGIWNPWTHTLFENDTIDFWNIKGKKGTVRFAGFKTISSGPVYAEFEALHEHVVFKKDGSEKVALNELQTVRVYKSAANINHYIVDITSSMRCASASPLLLLTYRYGGLGWRATEEWNKSNCEVLTSEGKTRKDTDGSRAKWCIVQGALDNDHGGIVLMSYPENYNHPEPMRIWDEKANGGRGDMFFNFSPTKDKDWLLEPGKTYVLKYRLIVFNGKYDAATAENNWIQFVQPVQVTSK